jgi:hypothetical protein
MNKDTNILRYFLVGVVLMFAAYWILLLILLTSWEVRSQFGEMFGALSALFSALAFSAVAYSIFLQREALALQRQELDLTRNEVAKTAKLNALATLAQTYSESLTWMQQSGKSAAAIAYVSALHGEVIRETERLCGMSKSLYDEA